MKCVIVGFEGSWSSGLATLLVQDEDGSVASVFCDNAPTVRALTEAFGEEVIGPAYTVNQDAIKGKTIDYELDSLGILASFTVPEAKA